jgi:hypothetical protein
MRSLADLYADFGRQLATARRRPAPAGRNWLRRRFHTTIASQGAAP